MRVMFKYSSHFFKNAILQSRDSARHRSRIAFSSQPPPLSRLQEQARVRKIAVAESRWAYLSISTSSKPDMLGNIAGTEEHEWSGGER